MLCPTHAGLLFEDSKNVQYIATLDEAILGTIVTSKTRTGIPSPLVATHQGFPAKDLHAPILKYQKSSQKVQEYLSYFILPAVGGQPMWRLYVSYDVRSVPTTPHLATRRNRHR